jgi:hypothetical protein
VLQFIEMESLMFAPESAHQAANQQANLWGNLAGLSKLEEASFDLEFRLKTYFTVDLDAIAAVTQLRSAPEFYISSYY